MSKLTWANTALKHTQISLLIGSSNKPERVKETSGLSGEYVMRLRSQEVKWEKKNDSWQKSYPTQNFSSSGSPKENIRIWAKRGEEYRAGNCGENAALAFVYLLENAIDLNTTISYAMISDPQDPRADHCFVVLGRDATNNGSTVESWGKDAVICDPWGDLVCTQPELLNESKQMQKYICYWSKAGKMKMYYDENTNLVKF